MEYCYYLGIDLDDRNAVISYFQSNKKEPETVGTVTGSERFQIPLLLTKRQGTDQWVIGEEAGNLALQQGERAVRDLLSTSLDNVEISVDGRMYQAKWLLAIYLKKLILLAGSLGNGAIPDKVVICLKKLSRETTDLFFEIAPLIGLQEDRITLIDREESFYYFALAQKEELWIHDVCLFDYRGERMQFLRLERNLRTIPQLVTLEGETYRVDERKRDESFLSVLQKCLAGCVASSVYLVGDGFEGEWMKSSLSFLCRGRRAFVGKNLYSKGACYAAAARDGQMEWPFVYMGDNEMKVNVSLKMHNCGQIEFFTLINAGDNWYEAVGECEVILCGTPEISFWLQHPNSREAKIEKLELSDLPKREDKTTRLRIVARPVSDIRVQIQIKDLGFGELVKSSGKVWDYEMEL